ncbi:MAG: hypothetical protein U0984_11160, partial [Prosthecobacter sp.]|nr:hypothetical protein [Prosthecobacter sp.]
MLLDPTGVDIAIGSEKSLLEISAYSSTGAGTLRVRNANLAGFAATSASSRAAIGAATLPPKMRSPLLPSNATANASGGSLSLTNPANQTAFTISPVEVDKGGRAWNARCI